MSIASSQTLNWTPPDAEEDFESDGTLAIPPEECPLVVSADVTEYVTLIEKQRTEYARLGDNLLLEVADRIRRLAPLEVDGETQQLLDAAIEHQEAAPCDDLEAWASRLVEDVKNAND